MRFDENLAAIHGYLCGDGYVIRNRGTQSHKFYIIGFRNTNLVLLRDFRSRFKKVFGLEPIISKDLDRCKINNKNLYFVLTNNFSYYSREWEIPLLSKKNLRFWLRAFFDCEAWVENRPRQSRLIGLDCCHEEGLLQVQKALNRFDIKFNVKKRLDRDIWSLVLYGKENLKKFQKEIGFFHPKKKKKLEEAINSYVNYRWKIPLKKKELYRFVNFKGVKYGEGRIKFHSIVKASLLDLKKALNKYGIKSKLGGPWINNHGSVNYDLRIRIKEVKW